MLEALREPLEESRVVISRASGTMTFPANFMLVAAMNPCPCGFYGDPKRECRCSPAMIQRYRNRISGPLLDRVDIHVEVPAVKYKEMAGEGDGRDFGNNPRSRGRGAANSARTVCRPRWRQLQRPHVSERHQEALPSRRGMPGIAQDGDDGTQPERARLRPDSEGELARLPTSTSQASASNRSTSPKPSNTARWTVSCGCSGSAAQNRITSPSPAYVIFFGRRLRNRAFTSRSRARTARDMWVTMTWRMSHG